MDWYYSHWEGEAIYPYLMTGTAKFARKSDFNQLIPISGFFVESTQLKTVVSKQLISRGLPLFLVLSVHAFDFFGVVVKVSGSIRQSRRYPIQIPLPVLASAMRSVSHASL